VSIYTSRPDRRQARKAWDKFVRDHNGEEPEEMYYTDNYDSEFKGWVCMRFCPTHIKFMKYAAWTHHCFYHSAEL